MKAHVFHANHRWTQLSRILNGTNEKDSWASKYLTQKFNPHAQICLEPMVISPGVRQQPDRQADRQANEQTTKLNFTM